MITTCVADPSHDTPVFFLQRNGVAIYRCPRCRCLMADAAFNPQIYEKDRYYSMKFTTREGIDRYWGFRWRYVLERIRRHAALGSLLDVGAGNGYFVYLARSAHGMDAAGIEISRTEIDFARRVLGVELGAESLHEHRRRDYSVVTLFNVLEHVPSPRAILEEARRHLDAGGALAVTTPNPSCVHVRVKGLKQWGMIDPPHHLNLFTRAGLERLLRDVGFRLAHYETLSTYMEWLWKYDTPGQHLRRALFRALRAGNLGADHFLIARAA